MGKLLLLGMLIILYLPTQSACASGIDWRSGIGQAQVDSQNSGKLMMIDFYTDWCEWCHKLDADVYPNARVESAMSQFVPVRLNAEQDGAALATRFGVNGYPTILFVDSQWHEVHRIVGYEPASDFAAELNQVANAAGVRPAATAVSQWTAPPSGLSDKTIPLGLMSDQVVDPYAGMAPRQAIARANNFLDRHNYAEADAIAMSLTKQGKGAWLPDLYNRLGDVADAHNQADAAWGWYVLTTKSTTDVPDLAHAYLKIGQYYASIDNAALARANLESVIGLANAPADVTAQAQTIMARLQ
jgi:thioredoxin-related protein